jgi:hypothetical protein
VTTRILHYPATRRINLRTIADAICWLADFTTDAGRVFAYIGAPVWIGLNAIVWNLVQHGHTATAVLTIIATAVIGVALVIVGLLPDQPAVTA